MRKNNRNRFCLPAFAGITSIIFLAHCSGTGKKIYLNADTVLQEGVEECNYVFKTKEKKETCKNTWSEHIKNIEESYKQKKYKQDEKLCSNPDLNISCIQDKQKTFYYGVLSNFLNDIQR